MFSPQLKLTTGEIPVTTSKEGGFSDMTVNVKLILLNKIATLNTQINNESANAIHAFQKNKTTEYEAAKLMMAVYERLHDDYQSVLDSIIEEEDKQLVEGALSL